MLENHKENELHGQFLADVRRRDICFLIGNGLCRYFNDVDWGSVLRGVFEQSVKADNNPILEKTFENLMNVKINEAFSHPEIYTSFLLKNKSRKSEDPFKKSLKDVLEAPIQKTCGLLQYALKKETQILTTNFDYTIERLLGFKTSKARGVNVSNTRGAATSDVYPYGEYFAHDCNDNLYLEPETAGKDDTGHYVTDKCAVWHIHGSIHNCKSIQLGFEDYLNAIIHLKYLQSHSAEAPKHYAEPWDDSFVQKNSWLRLFFTRPLVIVGCGINSEEIFLRWLLLRRQRQVLLRKDNFRQPPTYYLETELDRANNPDLDNARRIYFESLGIKVIHFKDYHELYDGPQWNT